ncbi:MAG TPA: hypothetical protein ENN77_02785 [Candidatus Wirthbacteria bacterium]|nr:hypothetical protein [Candidatus Wirthbacteria bacterium]
MHKPLIFQDEPEEMISNSISHSDHPPHHLSWLEEEERMHPSLNINLSTSCCHGVQLPLVEDGIAEQAAGII